MAYEDDFLFGSARPMHDYLVKEGHDSRLLEFAAIGRKHNSPYNHYDWVTGCLGIVDVCTSACETSFTTCVSGKTTVGTAAQTAFAECIDSASFSSLSGCATKNGQCAPNLSMLRLSEDPKTVILAEENFGGYKADSSYSQPPTSKCSALGKVADFRTGDASQMKPTIGLLFILALCIGGFH